MKTAISLPDEVFDSAERLAKRLKKSRSQLYRDALAEYVARHDPAAVTAAFDRIVDEVGQQPDAFVSAAGRRALERTEW